jgi:hypothetical protein
MRFRIENDPRKDWDLSDLALSDARERAAHRCLEIITGAFAILQGAMLLPDSTGATGDAPILLELTPGHRQQETVYVWHRLLRLEHAITAEAANESRMSCGAAPAGAPGTQPSPQARWRTT